jgi:aspartyl-tRNA(Asn)/glutamyl-tRNA(Gln) amidotransferase subunit B
MPAARNTALIVTSVFGRSQNPFICYACRKSLIARSSLPWRPPVRKQHTAASQDLHDSTVPFRKRLKDEAKAKKASRTPAPSPNHNNAKLEKWELTVGLEIHAELNTAHKLFSPAATSSNAPQNTHVALFDAAFPGSQPQFQSATLIPAVRAALALGCAVQQKSSWDRKHYFYPDQPNGYQITQYYGMKPRHLILRLSIC